MGVKMKKRIGIVRFPETGCYVIIDNRGFPRTVGKWEEAVEALRALRWMLTAQ
jgi:hypothetical protein